MACLLIKILFSLSILALLNSCSADAESSVSSRDSDARERDSVVVHDSVNVIDSIRIIDSVVVKDSVRIIDSVRVKDKVKIRDSVRIVDSVDVKDSVHIIDSVNVKDSVRIIDSVNVKDSVRIIDSVKVRDSVHVVDSVKVRDSVAVRDPEYFLGKCSQENKGTLKSAIIQDELRYFLCDEGTVMWRAQQTVIGIALGRDSVFAKCLDSVFAVGGDTAIAVCRDSAIARSRGQDTLVVDTIPELNDDWYMIDRQLVNQAESEAGGGWEATSYYTYTGRYSGDTARIQECR